MLQVVKLLDVQDFHVADENTMLNLIFYYPLIIHSFIHGPCECDSWKKRFVPAQIQSPNLSWSMVLIGTNAAYNGGDLALSQLLLILALLRRAFKST